MSSLNSLHPCSNFATGKYGQKSILYMYRGLVNVLPFWMLSCMTAFFFSLVSLAHLTKGAIRYSSSFIGRSFNKVSSNQPQETILTVLSRRAFWTRKFIDQYASMRRRNATCRTHCHILLEVFLAANKVRDLRRDIIGNGASVYMYPFPNLFRRALISEVARDCYREAFQWLFPHC